MLVLIKAMSVIFVTFTVVRSAAFGAHNNVVTAFELFIAYGAFVLSKFHNFLRIFFYKLIITNKNYNCNNNNNLLIYLKYTFTFLLEFGIITNCDKIM